MDRQTCTKCGIEKPLIKFELRADTQKYRPDCKDCRKAYSKKYYYKNKEKLLDKFIFSKYNINKKELQNLRNNSKGKCNICKKSCTTGRKLAIDHCHNTGKVRGLLCSKCNLMLGQAKDNINILKSAINYLEENL